VTGSGQLLNMRTWQFGAGIWLCGLLLSFALRAAGETSLNETNATARTFMARGIVMELKTAGEQAIVIRHEAISNYMDAMTMPFKVKDPEELAGLRRGDTVSFQLHVTETESWVDQIHKTGFGALPEKKSEPQKIPAISRKNPLLEYKFTNELGQAVSLDDFHGDALAITFIYTRCPLPEFCPRLSKNFQEASQKLSTMANAPTNWHLLSVTFDPEIDSPAMLKAYGDSYHYDPAHWSFLTGPADKIGELAQSSGVTFEPDAGTINHNFRTLIIDAAGHLQMVFPTSGNLSDAIADEIIKAAAATNPPALQSQ
jgi:protein SCO1/2